MEERVPELDLSRSKTDDYLEYHYLLKFLWSNNSECVKNVLSDTLANGNLYSCSHLMNQLGLRSLK